MRDSLGFFCSAGLWPAGWVSGDGARRKSRRDAGGTKSGGRRRRDAGGTKMGDPGPVFEAGFHRISFDVFSEFKEMRLTANQVVEIFTLPEDTRAAQFGVGGMSGIGLPGLEDRSESESWQGRKKNMNMVGHDAPGEKPIALRVKMPNGARYNQGHPRVAQVAASQALVQAVLSFS